MIYGRLNNEISNEVLFSAERLKRIISWPGSITNEINYGDFSGGFLYDPKLPYRNDDFFFIDNQKDVLVLMSGVIYNQDELIERLNLNVNTLSAPELVLKAYTAWGKNFVKKINGDFAIFIYELKSNVVHLFRDHLGIRPLAFTLVNNTFWFASDAFGLCKAIYANENIDKAYVDNQIVNTGLGSLPLLSDCTLLPNNKVIKVLPAHYLSFTNSNTTQVKYWFPEDLYEQNHLDFETVIKEIKTLIVNAVKIRCDKRFIASSHLSGGLDSGVVGSLARREYYNQEEFYGFCWTSEKMTNDTLAYDERILVKKIGEHINISPFFVNIDTEDYKKFLSGWRYDTDLFYELKVRENAIQKGVNLIFSGWGGDEFISINNIGIDSDLFFKLQWRSFFKKNPISKPKKLLSTFIYKILLPAVSLRFYSRKKSFSAHSKYINFQKKEKRKTINDFYCYRSRKEMHLRYLYQYHLSERIEDWNINGCRNGIEYRYPLLDKRIIEFMFKTPSRLLFKNGFSRILLREIGEGMLPDEIRSTLSKNDPVRINHLYTLKDEVCKELFEEVNDFRSNPIFDFINFDLLEKDIEDFRKGINEERPSEQFEMLFFLKKTHEFTKAYYN